MLNTYTLYIHLIFHTLIYTHVPHSIRYIHIHYIHFIEFIRLAAVNGMDVFRIFDCFNIVANMQGKGQNYGPLDLLY